MDDDALTRRVLACCHAVHRELGPGYPDATYRFAITRELEKAKLVFKVSERLPVIYDGEEIDRIEVDFLLEKLTLTVISKSVIDKQEVARALACLRSSGLTRGLLVNFSGKELEVRRISNVARTRVAVERV